MSFAPKPLPWDPVLMRWPCWAPAASEAQATRPLLATLGAAALLAGLGAAPLGAATRSRAGALPKAVRPSGLALAGARLADQSPVPRPRPAPLPGAASDTPPLSISPPRTGTTLSLAGAGLMNLSPSPLRAEAPAPGLLPEPQSPFPALVVVADLGAYGRALLDRTLSTPPSPDPGQVPVTGSQPTQESPQGRSLSLRGTPATSRRGTPEAALRSPNRLQVPARAGGRGTDRFGFMADFKGGSPSGFSPESSPSPADRPASHRSRKEMIGNAIYQALSDVAAGEPPPDLEDDSLELASVDGTYDPASRSRIAGLADHSPLPGGSPASFMSRSDLVPPVYTPLSRSMDHDLDSGTAEARLANTQPGPSSQASALPPPGHSHALVPAEPHGFDPAEDDLAETDGAQTGPAAGGTCQRL